MHERVQKVIDVLDVLKSIYAEEDVHIAVSDTEKIVAISPSKTLNYQQQVGDKIDKFKNLPTFAAYKTGKTVVWESEEKALRVVTAPILDGKTVIGAIIILHSNKEVQRLRNNSKDLFSSVQQISSTTKEIEYSSQLVLSSIKLLEKETENMTKKTSEIFGILSLIQNISNQSNLLGLNASIEAARVGEAGKGFGIIASEIRKMADISEKSAKRIEKQVKEIQNSVAQTETSIKNMVDSTDKHLQNVDNLRKTYTHVEETIKELSEK